MPNLGDMAGSPPGSRKKSKSKGPLTGLNVTAADGGGFIIRCEYHSKGSWESTTKVFVDRDEMIKFLSSGAKELKPERG